MGIGSAKEAKGWVPKKGFRSEKNRLIFNCVLEQLQNHSKKEINFIKCRATSNIYKKSRAIPLNLPPKISQPIKLITKLTIPSNQALKKPKIKINCKKLSILNTAPLLIPT